MKISIVYYLNLLFFIKHNGGRDGSRAFGLLLPCFPYCCYPCIHYRHSIQKKGFRGEKNILFLSVLRYWLCMNMPVPDKKRIEVVDALRGFALLGIILAHMNYQYYVGYMPPLHENIGINNAVDARLRNLHIVFVFGKFYSIFSFLFGLSFGIQMLNAKEKGLAFLRRFAWKLVLLFAIGFLHHMHYGSDVLTIYAVLGFGLLLFRKTNKRVLLFLAFVFILNIPGFTYKIINYINSKPGTERLLAIQSSNDALKQIQENEATQYYNIVKKGNYAATLKANITYHFKNKFVYQVFNGRLLITMGLFFLGLFFARKRFFENLGLHIKAVKQWFWFSTAFCVTLIACYFLFKVKLYGTVGLFSLVVSFITDTFNMALAIVYFTGFILLFNNKIWQKNLQALVSIGRMALTTYLIQTILGILIFYGYGFNLLGVIGGEAAFCIGVVIFTAQVYFSKWWMEDYYYGPLEWFWRSLTYLKVQPLRKSLSGIPRWQNIIFRRLSNMIKK